MKTKLLLLMLIVNVSYAQVTDVLTNLSSAGVANLTYKDNYIYYTSYTQKKIFKFDYTLSNPTPELVYQFNESPNYLYIKDNILYVGVESPNKTYKINLSCDNIQPVSFANLSGPMTQIGNDLYIGQYVLGKIAKIELTTNVQNDVITGYQPNFFTLFNNELYFTSNVSNSIYKYNASDNSIITILSNLNYASGIAINNDYLFICESSGNSISYRSTVNLQTQNSIQLGSSSWPNGSIIINEELYFVQTVAGKISKIQLTNLRGESFAKLNNSVNIYPNPVEEYLNIKSETLVENYEIYTTEGKLVQNSKIENNGIDVTNLSKGSYVLLLDKKPTTFIKN
jgi:hypothetical protein